MSKYSIAICNVCFLKFKIIKTHVQVIIKSSPKTKENN